MELKSVNFKKPDIDSLKKQGFMCIDTHCHTNYSDGKKLNLILRECKKKGIGIAITDHNEIKGALEAAKQKEVPVIPGIEINSSDGPHFLCYFYNTSELEDFYKRFIEPKKYLNIKNRINMSLLDIIDKLETYNCVTCLPHPYAPLWANINKMLVANPENKKVVEFVDAIEVISGLQRKAANRRAQALQILFGKASMAGSDAHGINEIGSCLTLAKAENIRDFLDAIRKKKTIAIGKEKIRQKAIHMTRVLRKGSKKITKIVFGKSMAEEIKNEESRVFEQKRIGQT